MSTEKEKLSVEKSDREKILELEEQLDLEQYAHRKTKTALRAAQENKKLEEKLEQMSIQNAQHFEALNQTIAKNRSPEDIKKIEDLEKTIAELRGQNQALQNRCEDHANKMRYQYAEYSNFKKAVQDVADIMYYVDQWDFESQLSNARRQLEFSSRALKLKVKEEVDYAFVDLREAEESFREKNEKSESDEGY